jgi:hypothetical protein
MAETQYEYQAVREQVLTSGGGQLEDVLNQKARDGWELVAISPSGYWVFKRRTDAANKR